MDLGIESSLILDDGDRKILEQLLTNVSAEKKVTDLNANTGETQNDEGATTANACDYLLREAGPGFKPERTFRQLAHRTVIPIPFSRDGGLLQLNEPKRQMCFADLLGISQETVNALDEWTDSLDLQTLYSGDDLPPMPCLGKLFADETLDGVFRASLALLARDTHAIALDDALCRLADAASDSGFISEDWAGQAVARAIDDIPRGLRFCPVGVFGSQYPEYRGEGRSVEAEINAVSRSPYRLYRISEALSRYWDTYGRFDAECMTFKALALGSAYEQTEAERIPDKRCFESLCLRFGFGGPALTLDSIASEKKLTKERIRQLVNTALEAIGYERSPRLVSCRLAVVTGAMSLGMAGSVADLVSLLSERDEWPGTASYEPMVKMSPDLVFSGKKFRIRSLPCAECSRGRDLIRFLFKYEDTMSVYEFAKAVGCLERCGVRPSGDSITYCYSDSRYARKFVGNRDGLIGSKTSDSMFKSRGGRSGGYQKSIAVAVVDAFKRLGEPLEAARLAEEVYGKGYTEGDLTALRHFLDRRTQRFSCDGQDSYALVKGRAGRGGRARRRKRSSLN